MLTERRSVLSIFFQVLEHESEHFKGGEGFLISRGIKNA